jgi:hypothetical protein
MLSLSKKSPSLRPRQVEVTTWMDGMQMCGAELSACPGLSKCTPRVDASCSLETDAGCMGECTAPLNSNGRQACGTSDVPVHCPSGTYCKLSNEKDPDLGGECVDRESAGRWDDRSPKCGSGLPQCTRPSKCMQRAGTTCGPESGCPGECVVIKANGRRQCYAMNPGAQGACPPGEYCKMLYKPGVSSDEGGECTKGSCPNPAQFACY